jgi:hypothetical protein
LKSAINLQSEICNVSVTILVMSWLMAVLVACAFVPFGESGWLAQRRGAAPARRPAPPPPAPPRKVAVEMVCPALLGSGITTRRTFCDVMTGGNPAEGIIIDLPPHVGPVTLTFDLHNRQLYSEEMIKANRAFARYTASIGVMAMDVTLISRAVIQSEFRSSADLFDRVSGGAGPGGVKAVAPTGIEPITIVIPEPETRVSILGEKLTVERIDGSATYSTSGRPIAIISNVMIEYRPAPTPPTTKKPVGRL